MSRASVALGLGGGVLALLLLAAPLGAALAGLWSARQTHADLMASLSAPPPPVRPLLAPGLAITAADRAAAARSLATMIRGRAASAGVLVEALAPASSPSGIVALRIRLSGQEKAVIAMLDGIERGTPLVRFRSWRATALADGGVRVEGEMAAAWR